MTSAIPPRRHENEKKEDCWCQPAVIPVKQDDGSIDWIYVHNREVPDAQQ